MTDNHGKFKKGNVPWNAGLKGTYSLPNENETSFKSGTLHPRYKPIGSEREDKDGYLVIKAAERKWLPKHRYIWEQANGPIPKGHVVIFGNGDKRDFRPENLLLVTRAQLAIINKYGLIFDSEELTRSGLILSDLILRITELKKGM